tara:strand:+ start:6766 stop:6990 length:225 start_codon:yes stop_codon:yes gene_type:complete
MNKKYFMNISTSNQMVTKLVRKRNAQQFFWLIQTNSHNQIGNNPGNTNVPNQQSEHFFHRQNTGTEPHQAGTPS